MIWPDSFTFQSRGIFLSGWKLPSLTWYGQTVRPLLAVSSFNSSSVIKLSSSNIPLKAFFKRNPSSSRPHLLLLFWLACKTFDFKIISARSFFPQNLCYRRRHSAIQSVSSTWPPLPPQKTAPCQKNEKGEELASSLPNLCSSHHHDLKAGWCRLAPGTL